MMMTRTFFTILSLSDFSVPKNCQSLSADWFVIVCCLCSSWQVDLFPSLFAFLFDHGCIKQCCWRLQCRWWRVWDAEWIQRARRQQWPRAWSPLGLRRCSVPFMIAWFCPCRRSPNLNCSLVASIKLWGDSICMAGHRNFPCLCIVHVDAKCYQWTWANGANGYPRTVCQRTHEGQHVERIWKLSMRSMHRPGLCEMMPELLDRTSHGFQTLSTASQAHNLLPWKPNLASGKFELMSCYWLTLLIKTGSFANWWAASRSRFGFVVFSFTFAGSKLSLLINVSQPRAAIHPRKWKHVFILVGINWGKRYG